MYKYLSSIPMHLRHSQCLMRLLSFGYFLCLMSPVCVPILLHAQTYDLNTLNGQQEFAWGVRSYHRGFYNEAALSFTRVVAQEEDSLLARLWLARSYYVAGFRNAALEQYQILDEIQRPSPFIQSRIDALTTAQNIDQLLIADPQYTLAEEINGRTGGGTVFSSPSGIAIDENINLYVSSFASHEVLKFSTNGEVQHNVWQNRYQFDRPYSVLLDGEDILVSEFGKDRVVRFDRAGAQEVRFNRGGATGLLAGPQYLAVDNAKNIFVSDWGNQRIVKFNSNGNFIYQFSRMNIPGRPQFSPTGIVYHNAFLHIANAADSTIVVIDPNGNYVHTLMLNRMLRIEGLASFDARRILIAAKEGIFTYSVDNEVLIQIADTAESALTSIALDANGTLYGTDFNRNRILIFSPIDQIYGGLTAHTLNIDSTQFPEIAVDVRIEDRFGSPIAGLRSNNFSLRENTPVADITVEYVRSEERPHAIMLVVPLTEGMLNNISQLQLFVAELLLLLDANDQAGVIFSGIESTEKAALGTPFVRIRSYLPEIANTALAKYDESFGTAIQLATSQLLRTPAKRTIIYIDDGTPIQNPFPDIAEQNIADAIDTNAISFTRLSFTGRPPQENSTPFYNRMSVNNVEYLGGNTAQDIIAHATRNHDGRYRLHYTSSADSDFGRRYIPLSVTAFLHQRSGRDELGYYAPTN